MMHVELYYRIVKEENIEQLFSIMSERLGSLNYRIIQLEILQENDFPYICCQVSTDEIFCALMTGFFVDIKSIIYEYNEPYYYLPVIVYCDDYDDRIKGFIDKKISIEHELQHIKDMIELIKKYPDYPARSYRYGMNSITSVEDLAESIDLEMFKLFYIEPPAMRMDFYKGDRHILMPFDDKGKTVVRCECDSAEEYVAIQLDSYIMRIKSDYKERFKDNEEAAKLIAKEMDKGLTNHGKDVFGCDPVNGLKEFKNKFAPKLLLSMLNRQFV